MAVLKKIINSVSHTMHIISGALLIGMMTVTLLDVVTRTLYGLTDGEIALTFVGGVELIKYGLLFTVLFTLPQSIGDAQVIVDLFTDSLSEKTKTSLEAFYILGFALLGAGMTYRFYLEIDDAMLTGQTTQDLLIPMHWIYSIVVFATGVLTLRCLILTGDLLTHRPSPNTLEQSASRKSKGTSQSSHHQHKEVL